MNVVEPNAELTLELARAAAEPSDADRLRNLAALRTRLGSPASAAPGSNGAGARTRVGSSGHPMASPRNAVTRGVSSQTARLVRLVAFGALTGVIGFWLGTSASERNASERDTADVAATGPASPAAAEAEHTLLEAASLPAESTAPHAAASDIGATPEASPATRSEPLPSVPARAAPQRGARARQTLASARAAAPLPSASADPTFREAVRLLQRAQRAIDGGDPAVGMSLLDQLDARFPSALLNEERQAARVLGWCASGETDRAFAAAQALGMQNAGSIYGPRLERSCVALATPREKN